MSYDKDQKKNIIEKVLVLITEMSMRDACIKLKVPDSTISAWMVATPELAGQYTHARSIYHDKLADDCMSIASEAMAKNHHGDIDNAAVQQAKLKIDSIRWYLSKVSRGKYGNHVTLANDVDNPLNVNKIELTVVDPKTTEGGDH